MGGDIDPTNPYDPPERQTLEEQLYHDQQLQQADHQGVLAERHIIDAANAAGVAHQPDDQRLTNLEHNEQLDAARVVRDQQNIDTWDQGHPGWQSHLDDYQPAGSDSPSPEGQPGDYPDTDSGGELYASAPDGGDGSESDFG